MSVGFLDPAKRLELSSDVKCPLRSKLEIDEDALAAYFYQNGNQNNNGGGQNGYNYYGQQGGQNGEMGLFVGPYCSSNGKNIFLGVFHDETCSYQAEAGIYEKFSYGQALPYSSESIISSECISCKEPQDANDQNNGDQQDEDEVLEICERLYEDAGKCESGLADGVTYYPTTYGCDFISSLHAPGKMNSAKNSSSVSAAQVFAGLFAATTAIFGAVAFYFHKKQQRGSVDLSGQDGCVQFAFTLHHYVSSDSMSFFFEQGSYCLSKGTFFLCNVIAN